MTEAFSDADPANIARHFIAPEGVILSVEDVLEKLRTELHEDEDPMAYLGGVLRDLPKDEQSWSLNNVASRYAYSTSVHTVFGAAMALSKSTGISTESFCQPLREIPTTEEEPTPWLGNIPPARATYWAALHLEAYGPEDLSIAFPLVEFLNSYVQSGEDPNIKRAIYSANPDNRPPFEQQAGANEKIAKLRQATAIIHRFWDEGAREYPKIAAIAEDISLSDPDLAVALTIKSATALLEAAPHSIHADSAKQATDSLLREVTGNPNFAEQSIIVEDAIAREVQRRLSDMQRAYGLDYPSDFSDKKLAETAAAAQAEISELKLILKVIGTHKTGFNPKYDYEHEKLYGANVGLYFEEWVINNPNLNPDQKAMAILSDIGEDRGQLNKPDFYRSGEVISDIEKQENRRRHLLKELGLDLKEAPLRIGSIHNREPSIHFEYDSLDEFLASLPTYWEQHDYINEVYDNRKANVVEQISNWYNEAIPGEFTYRDSLVTGLTIARNDTDVLRISGLRYDSDKTQIASNGRVELDNDGSAELILWPSEDEINGVIGKSPENWDVYANNFYAQIVSNAQLTPFVDYIHKMAGVSCTPEELSVEFINGGLKIESDALSITLMNALVTEDETISVGFSVSTWVNKYGGQQSVQPCRVEVKPSDYADRDVVRAVYSRFAKLSRALPSLSRPAEGWRGSDNGASLALPDYKARLFLEELSRRDR